MALLTGGSNRAELERIRVLPRLPDVIWSWFIPCHIKVTLPAGSKAIKGQNNLQDLGGCWLTSARWYHTLQGNRNMLVNWQEVKQSRIRGHPTVNGRLFTDWFLWTLPYMFQRGWWSECSIKGFPSSALSLLKCVVGSVLSFWWPHTPCGLANNSSLASPGGLDTGRAVSFQVPSGCRFHYEFEFNHKTHPCLFDSKTVRISQEPGGTRVPLSCPRTADRMVLSKLLHTADGVKVVSKCGYFLILVD